MLLIVLMVLIKLLDRFLKTVIVKGEVVRPYCEFCIGSRRGKKWTVKIRINNPFLKKNIFPRVDLQFFSSFKELLLNFSEGYFHTLNDGALDYMLCASAPLRLK